VADDFEFEGFSAAGADSETVIGGDLILKGCSAGSSVDGSGGETSSLMIGPPLSHTHTHSLSFPVGSLSLFVSCARDLQWSLRDQSSRFTGR
jgi:hypothetical protein